MSLQLERYTFGEAVLLNQPGNANYCLATHRQSKKQYILKIYSPQSSEESDRVAFELQRNTQAQSSKGVVEILSFCHQFTRDTQTGIPSKKTYILMRYVSTNLRDIIAKRKSTNNYFSSEEFERHMRQLLKTLAELQEAKISHGRIELEKIFAQNDNGDLLIGDFWDAQNLFDFEKSELVDIDYQNVVSCKFPDQESLLALINGKDKYLANYYKQDVYSLGIVACQMATLNIYSNHLEFNKKLNADKASILERYGQGVVNLIDQLLAPREKRQDFTQLIKDVNKYFKRNLSQIAEETRTPSSDESIQQFPEYTQESIYVPSNVRSDLPGGQNENSDVDINNRLIEVNQTEFPLSLINNEPKYSNPSNFIQLYNSNHQTLYGGPVGQFHEISDIKNSSEANDRQLYYDLIAQSSQELLQDQYNRISKINSVIKTTQTLHFADLIQQAKSLNNLTWIDLEKLQLNNSIGEGSKTESFLCSVNQQNTYVAKKYYENDNFKLLEILKNFSKLNSLDIKLSVKVDFFNIKQIQGEESRSELIIIQKRKIFSLVTLAQKYRLCLKDKVKIAEQIATVLIDMHKNNVIHGSLKPENILLDMQKNVFLTDFGQLEMPSADHGSTWMCSSNYFEPIYLAPEQFNDLQVCKNSDIWSLGVIIYEFVFETKASQGLIEYYKLYNPSIQGCIDLANPSLTGLFIPFSKLIKSMTQFDPEKRINLDDVKKQLDLLYKSIKVDRQTQQIEPAKLQMQQQLSKQQLYTDIDAEYQKQQQQQLSQNQQNTYSLGQFAKPPQVQTDLSKRKS